MSLVLTSFSADELERYVLCAPPDMAAAAQTELDARGLSNDGKVRDLAELDDEIEAAENEVRMAERCLEDAEDEVEELRRKRKEREAQP